MTLKPFSFIAPNYLDIIWFSHISVLSVHDDGYSRNASCVLNMISSKSFLVNLYYVLKKIIILQLLKSKEFVF